MTGVVSLPAVPLAQDEADALQRLLEGAQVNIDHPIVAGTTTLEDVQQLLNQRGLEDMASNLRTKLNQSKHPKSRLFFVDIIIYSSRSSAKKPGDT